MAPWADNAQRLHQLARKSGGTLDGRRRLEKWMEEVIGRAPHGRPTEPSLEVVRRPLQSGCGPQSGLSRGALETYRPEATIIRLFLSFFFGK